MASTTHPTPDELADVFAPFDRDDFRADLRELAQSVREDWQRWAGQAVVIARMAGQVPDENGQVNHGTPWKSFIREVAVARRSSDQAAAREVFLSVSLVKEFPRALALVQAGQLPAYSARVLIEESMGCEPEVLTALDTELSDKACRLTPARGRAGDRDNEGHPPP